MTQRNGEEGKGEKTDVQSRRLIFNNCCLFVLTFLYILMWLMSILKKTSISWKLIAYIR